jgi:phosphohistidine phosphatase
MPKLYLMRHAEAEEGDQLDPTRPLTDTGKAQAQMMGHWLKHQTSGPALVIESNMRRSIETAGHVSEHLDAVRMRSHKLDPEATPEEALAEMQRQGRRLKADNVIAVSHGPLVGNIIGLLTGAGGEQTHFANGAVAHFETTGRVTEAKGEYYYDEVPMKRLILGDGGKSGNCDFCSDADDLGWIDDDDIFEGPDGDMDEPPLHPHCSCTVERKDRRVRVYDSDRKAPEGVRLYEARRPKGKLHWLITPEMVARMERQMGMLADEARIAVELAIGAAEAALVL